MSVKSDGQNREGKMLYSKERKKGQKKNGSSHPKGKSVKRQKT